MPRVRIKNKIYRQKDFKNLVREKMREQKVRQFDLASDMGITQPSLSEKLADGSFTHSDMLICINTLHFTDDEIISVMRI